MHIAVYLNASFVVYAGSCVWRLLSSSVATRRREGEGVRSPRLFSCGCGAPRVTALSWAPCPIEGGMAGNFGAASWMDEVPLARVAVMVGACSVCVVWWPFPVGCGNELGGDCGGYLLLLHGGWLLALCAILAWMPSRGV
ncbi:hypothetical protein BCY84_01928 [Trypanosoma cruzi cruzi]|nr:hypothetical protein BCY84_01928 [Trypanosoma cruzi cruzi]